MLRSLLFLLLLLTAPLGGFVRAAEVIPPPPARYFNDYAGVVPAATRDRLDARLAQFERDTSSQIVVAVYPRMQSSSSIEDYTVRVAQSWRVGQQAKDNGAVLFVFKDDHTLYIQVGYGLEGSLPDALCKRIINDEIVPRFRSGDFGGGLEAGVNALLAATQGEYTGSGRTVAERHAGRTGGKAAIPLFAPIIAIVLFILFIRWLLHAQGMTYTSNSRRSTWSNSGSGWGGWGGGGGGGGFSGGGGSFGGGGAGGHW